MADAEAIRCNSFHLAAARAHHHIMRSLMCSPPFSVRAGSKCPPIGFVCRIEDFSREPARLVAAHWVVGALRSGPMTVRDGTGWSLNSPASTAPAGSGTSWCGLLCGTSELLHSFGHAPGAVGAVARS